MADGLQKRYEDANVTLQRLLYVASDFCCESGVTRYHQLFPEWVGFLVRLAFKGILP